MPDERFRIGILQKGEAVVSHNPVKPGFCEVSIPERKAKYVEEKGLTR